MEIKKSDRADLESKIGIFFQIGLIIALGLSLAAFEWESPVRQIVIDQQWQPLVDDIIIKNTVIEERKPAPKPVSAPAIRIVDNTEFIKEGLEFTAEINPNDETPAYVAPAPVKPGEETSVAEDIPFVVVEKMPEFPGGMSALQTFLAKTTKYPRTAAETGIQGTVYMYFVVEKDGSVSSIKALRGLSGGCTEEAERVLALMPRWKLGNQFGKPVRVSFTVPVMFKLQ